MLQVFHGLTAHAVYPRLRVHAPLNGGGALIRSNSIKKVRDNVYKMHQHNTFMTTRRIILVPKALFAKLVPGNKTVLPGDSIQKVKNARDDTVEVTNR